LEDKLGQLNGEYANAQHDIADKARQIEEIKSSLSAAQKNIADKEKADQHINAQSQKELGD